MYVDYPNIKKGVCELIQYYYNCKSENAAGGILHVILDDGNLEDGSIWLHQVDCEEADDFLGLLILETLRSFSLEEREEMYSEYWGMK